ncbi:electron transfer flavoprotein beta subunit (plasmid) [Caballeronia sp. S22]
MASLSARTYHYYENHRRRLERRHFNPQDSQSGFRSLFRHERSSGRQASRNWRARQSLRSIGGPSFEAGRPLAVAQILKALVDQQKPKLVILGKQAIDDDSIQTGRMLAALARLPQATFASKVVVVVADGKATVSCEVDA